MKSLLRRRPSPALVISLIALFVSLSGVSYGVATGFIDSREIKNNEVRSLDIRNNQVRTLDLRNNEVRGIDIRNSTIQGRDIGLNQITGEDVREDTLQKVPSALLADTATKATSADSATTAGSVGGVSLRKFAYSAEASDGNFVSVLDFGGLVLEARCEVGPGLAIRANPVPGLQNSELWSVVGDATAERNLTASSNDFDPGENLPVAHDGNAVGVLVFAGADGSVVTVQAFALEDQNNVRGTTDDCGFFGIAQASS